MSSAAEGGPSTTTGMDAALSDAGNSLGGSCPNIDGFRGGFGTTVSDVASTIVGRGMECTAHGSAYGFPPTDMGALGAPAEAVGVEFDSPTAGGGSCEAVAAGAKACAGGTAHYLVNGPNAYDSTYALFDDGSQLHLSFGETPTLGFAFGTAPPANALVLQIEANNFDFVTLAAAR